MVGARIDPNWMVSRPDARTGEPGPVKVIDEADGPDGRIVCMVPGHLVWRSPDGSFVQLLDEQDLANAQLLAAAPALRNALQALLRWARLTGGWEAPCWEQTEALCAHLTRAPSAD